MSAKRLNSTHGCAMLDRAKLDPRTVIVLNHEPSPCLIEPNWIAYFDQHVLAGDPIDQMLVEALAHPFVVAGETDREWVDAVPVFRLRMGRVVDVDNPLAVDRRYRAVSGQFETGPPAATATDRSICPLVGRPSGCWSGPGAGRCGLARCGRTRGDAPRSFQTSNRSIAPSTAACRRGTQSRCSGFIRTLRRTSLSGRPTRSAGSRPASSSRCRRSVWRGTPDRRGRPSAAGRRGGQRADLAGADGPDVSGPDRS